MEKKTTKIVFLVLPNIHLMDLAGPDQVFFEAIDMGANLQVEYCSFTDNTRASSGLPLGSVQHFSQVSFNEGDYLMVSGASTKYIHSAEFQQNTDLLTWIKAVYEQKVNVCSICTGTFILAYAGILNEKTCTTHWKRTTELQTCFPSLKVIDNVLFNEDSRILTSAGLASGVDMALHILDRLEGQYFTHKVANELIIYNRREGNQPQKSELLRFRNHIHSGIHKVQDWLNVHLQNRATIEELAEIAAMSSRNFTRIFKKETGITVNDYITLLRKERIKELRKNPDITQTQIANQCGLKSDRHVRRLLS